MANIRTNKYLIDKISTDTDSGKMYIVVGNHSGLSSNTVSYTYEEIETVKAGHIFGKKVKPADYSPVIRSNIWSSNTVYERADIQVNGNYYILNQNNDVFKCIWNASNTASTSEPTTKSTEYIETADGYVWKYMYSITSGEMTKFAFTNYIPAFANTAVSNSAIGGAIDYIEVVDGGQNYSVHNTGTIQQSIGSNVYRIANTASSIANIYANSSIYIVNGTSAGLLKTISSSSSNATGKYIAFASNTVLSTDSEYIISPAVVIDSYTGSGFEAYSEVDENNSIDKITIINRGSGYKNATVSLVTAATVDVAANLHIITAPEEGHGFDPVKELASDRIVFTATFLNAEDTTLPQSNFSYYNTTLLYDPTVDVAAQNTASWGISIDVLSTFNVNDIVQGNTSGAKGIVYWSNTSHIKLNNVIGSFSNNEIVFNENGVNSTINIIKDKDVGTSTGSVLQYTIHPDGVDRSVNVSENIKYIFRLEGN